MVVTAEESADLPVLGITVVVMMIMLPILVCILMRIIAQKCPNSYLGKKLSACRA